MSDDLDDRLRAAMKVLDDEVPSGYFDALASRTLARLEDHEEMQTMSQQDSSSNRMSDLEASSGVPPQDDGRNDDSGLHDIRSLASSTKLRISKRFTTVPPPDDDILASSSAGWKAVALPEPARMVSLPELASLPTASEVKAKDKAARKVAKVAAPVEAVAALAVAQAEATDAVAAVTSTPMIGARFAKQPARSKAGLYAGIGIALAAAAGVLVYMKSQAGAPAATQVAAKAETAPTATPIEAPPPSPAPALAVVEPVPPPDPVAVAPAAPVAVAATEIDRDDKRARGTAAKKGDKPEPEKQIGAAPPAAPAKAAAKPSIAAAGGAPADGSEPSFDALLKEAGVQEETSKGPKLDKKSLSGADIKSAMGGVAGKAQGCYAGTQGTASVKLTVAPNGKISKVKVSGPFAGTPTAACVESAVRGAEFPAWDGGPQSVSYSYLLAE